MSSQQVFFIGIDGGGSKCKARLEDASGKVLAETIAGPANAARDLPGTITSIYTACDALLKQVSDQRIGYAQIHAGIGLAGVNLPEVRENLLAHSHPFASLSLSTDLHIACLGAHQGEEGAIIITGTGSSGVSMINGQTHEVGGHGFVLGDKGSGAWLGKMAVSYSLEAIDQLASPCLLTEQVLAELHCATTHQLVQATWEAKPSFFAQLAPLVLQQAAAQQSTAIRIVKEGADYISRLARRLVSNSPVRLAMIGGISGLLVPWLDDDIQALLSEAKLPPEAGAILLAKSNFNQ